MRYGSLPPSIARSLPAGPIEHRHAPDGLSEQAIDEMLDELDLAVPVPDVPSRPVWLSADPSGRRRNRRHVRQVVRSLPAVLRQPAETDTADDGAGRWSA